MDKKISFLKQHHIYKSKTSKQLLTYGGYDDKTLIIGSVWAL